MKQQILVVKNHTPKTFQFCMNNLCTAGMMNVFQKFTGSKQLVNKAKMIKTHEVLGCSGCSVCDPNNVEVEE